MGAPAGSGIQKQPLNGNDALRSKDADKQGWQASSDGPRPIGHAGWNRTSGGITVMPRISRR
jgi:hypothetical protein